MLIERFLLVCDRVFMKSQTLVILAATAASLLIPAAALAFDVGRSRVVSSPGQPLVIDVALRNVTAQEAQNLKVSIANTAAWQAAGLTPPVALEQLQVSVEPGVNDTSRVIRLSSSLASDQTVINVLLDVATDASRRAIQSSVIVAPPPAIRVASDQSLTVLRGDTLIGIANKFPVSGTSRYQMLWALFQANPKAFISQNMNLLRAGAALNIPDAETVRAIDPAFAKAQYLAQVQAFQRMRGGNTAVSASPVDVAGAPVTSAQNRGQVESAAVASAPATEDQVRLSATPVDVAADQQTSQARALAEEQARVQALNSNVDALTGAAAASGSSGQNNVSSQDPAVVASGPAAASASATGASSATNATVDATNAAIAAGTASGSAPMDSPIDGSTATPPEATSASADLTAAAQTAAGAAPIDSPITGSASTLPEATGALTDLTTAAQTATQTAAQTAAGAAPIDATGVSAGATESLVDSAAATAAQSTDGSAGTGVGASTATAPSSTTPSMTAGSAEPGTVEPAQDAVSQAIAWVSNNVAASIAIVLALFALILAWALRATGRQEKAQALGIAGTGLAETQQAFKDKLESIDLSLDDEKSVSSVEVDQTEKPAASKPDGTA